MYVRSIEKKKAMYEKKERHPESRSQMIKARVLEASYRPLIERYNFLCSSKNKNVAIV